MMSNFAPNNLFQPINPLSWFFRINDSTNINDNNSTNSLISINNYKTEDANTEHKITTEVAGYGMQINVTEQALAAVIAVLTDEQKKKLSPSQIKALDNFAKMMEKIQEKKDKLLLEKFSLGSGKTLINNLEALQEKDKDLYKTIIKQLKDYIEK